MPEHFSVVWLFVYQKLLRGSLLSLDPFVCLFIRNYSGIKSKVYSCTVFPNININTAKCQNKKYFVHSNQFSWKNVFLKKWYHQYCINFLKLKMLALSNGVNYLNVIILVC